MLCIDGVYYTNVIIHYGMTPLSLSQKKYRLFVNRRALESRLRLKCDGTHAETRFRLSASRTSPFKSAVASVQSTTAQPRCAHQR